LSGNKVHIILFAGLVWVLTGCGIFSGAKKSPPDNKTTTDTPVVKQEDKTIRQDTTGKLKPDSIAIEKVIKGKSWEKKEAYAITYALPFSMDGAELNQLMGSENITGYQPLASIEYYEGALLALELLDSLGIKLQVQVYNNYKDSSITAALFSKPEILASDVLIGPVFNEGLKAAAGIALKNEMFLISPLSPSHSFTDSNRYFMMANPDAESQMRALLNAVSKRSPQAQYTLIYRNEVPAEVNLAKEFKSAFQYVFNSTAQLKEAYSYSGAAAQLSVEENYVFIASFDELYTNGLIRDLSKKSRETPVTLLGLQHVLSFESVSIDYYENLHFTYPGSYYVDWLSPRADAFKEKFEARYATRPSEFACRGYDITLYAGLMMHEYGPDLAASAGKFNPAKRYMLYPLYFAPSVGTDNVVHYYENAEISVLRFESYRFERIDK